MNNVFGDGSRDCVGHPAGSTSRSGLWSWSRCRRRVDNFGPRTRRTRALAACWTASRNLSNFASRTSRRLLRSPPVSTNPMTPREDRFGWCYYRVLRSGGYRREGGWLSALQRRSTSHHPAVIPMQFLVVCYTDPLGRPPDFR